MTCCYLCKSSFECRLKPGGVFIPLQHHFEQYCLTDNFINCNHFIRYATVCGLDSPPSPNGSSKATLSRGERRFFSRQKAEFSVSLSSYESDRVHVVNPSSSALAQTIDFSQGGMRVWATMHVAKQGLLFFSFGEGFIAPLLHGLAEVCWQKTNVDTGYWEAGLSFTDQFVKAVIAVQMSS